MTRPASIVASGHGTPLVLVASPFVLAQTYRSLAQELARDFRVYVVELPGCGRGGHVSRPWNFHDCAAWLAGVLDGLRLQDVTLIGHSNSGAVTLLAAARYSHRVARLILADAVGADTTHSLLRTFAARAVDALVEWRLTLWGWPQLALNAYAHFRNFFYHVYLAGISDLRSAAAELRIPTLLAWGRLDHTMPLRCAAEYRRAIAGSQVYISPSGSHDWIVDHPLEFAAMARSWIAATSSTRSLPYPASRYADPSASHAPPHPAAPAGAL